jgi:hypothetical protein
VQAGRSRAGAQRVVQGQGAYLDVETACASKMEMELLRPPDRAVAAAPTEPRRSLRAWHSAPRGSTKHQAMNRSSPLA